MITAPEHVSVKLEAPNMAYTKELERRRSQLSKIVKIIQDAYDRAKVNNEQAHKLLLEEEKSRGMVASAVAVTKKQQNTLKLFTLLYYRLGG